MTDIPGVFPGHVFTNATARYEDGYLQVVKFRQSITGLITLLVIK